MSKELPKAEELKKFEVPEQAGINKDQSSTATAWVNLTQLLEKVVQILNGTTLDVVVADSIASNNPDLGERVIKNQETWKALYEAGAVHHRKCIEIIEKDKELLSLQIGLLHQLKKLPDDSVLVEKLTTLTRLLDGLEKHRVSGLIAAISKL
jgi:hypothetical protein